MIKSYGLFWRSDQIFWGRQKNKGSLLGCRTQGPNAKPIDFRNQRGVYALYADYELVYVGQAGSGDHRLFNRLRAHMTDHLVERWDRFSWFGTQWVTDQHRLSSDTTGVNIELVKALNILEAVGIAIAEPRLNLQRGKWGDAKQYYQLRDKRLDEAKS